MCIAKEQFKVLLQHLFPTCDLDFKYTEIVLQSMMKSSRAIS